jgi:hypothetical protein
MLETLAKIAAISVFVIVTGFVGIVLWQSLFQSKEQNYYRSEVAKQNSERPLQDSRMNEARSPVGSKQSTDDRVATYTLWLAVFTALLVAVSAFQISFLIRADETATRAAEAAKSSAEIAERTLRISQGANIGLYRWESRNIEVNKSPFFRAEIANAGHSIAVVLDDWSKLTVDNTLPLIPTYGSHATNNMLPPGGASFLELDTGATSPPVILTQQHVDELIAGKKKIFVWGRITFRDIFNEVWDYGYVIQFAPIKSGNGQVTWRDISPGIENYTFLTKRHGATGAPGNSGSE